MFMYETIKRIYLKTGNKDAVERALEKGWITADQAKALLGMEAAPEGAPE